MMHALKSIINYFRCDIMPFKDPNKARAYRKKYYRSYFQKYENKEKNKGRAKLNYWRSKYASLLCLPKNMISKDLTVEELQELCNLVTSQQFNDELNKLAYQDSF